jgi:hypothetical protein
MMACYCCERRLGQSSEPCKCASNYCDQCLMCMAHCRCTDEEIRTPTEVFDRVEAEADRQ